MLTARRTLVTLGLMLGLLGMQVDVALADGDVQCPPGALDCDITAEEPGAPGVSTPDEPSDSGSGGSTSERTCELEGREVPCHRDDIGDFNSADGCYWEQLDPQPSPGSREFETAAGYDDPPADWEPGDPGAFYNRLCPGNPLDGGIWFSATDPSAASVDPAQLARKAVEQMTLKGPEIGITPEPGGRGVVGMPVYMWTETGSETYGPQAESASAGAVTVTATAEVSKIVWEMGDGNTVTCTTAGTEYQAEFGKEPSPDCGHRYTKPSSTTGSGEFHVTATSTWTIDWSGGGQSGQLTQTRSSSVDVTVAEVQVLN